MEGGGKGEGKKEASRGLIFKVRRHKHVLDMELRFSHIIIAGVIWS